MTPLTTPNTLKMINLSFGHCIVYVTIRNLYYMGLYGCHIKICLKWLILVDFWQILGPLEFKYNYITHFQVPYDFFYIRQALHVTQFI